MARDRDVRPPRGPGQCTASVCVAGVHCYNLDLFGASKSMECNLSVLSIYPRIFLRVLTV